jgi:hypothetical protein
MGEPKGKTRVCPACDGFGQRLINTMIERKNYETTGTTNYPTYPRITTRVTEIKCYSPEKCRYCDGLGYKEVEY